MKCNTDYSTCTMESSMTKVHTMKCTMDFSTYYSMNYGISVRTTTNNVSMCYSHDAIRADTRRTCLNDYEFIVKY